METNCTPGPWSVFSTYAQPEVRWADGSLVAVLPVGELNDARLIAAAPDLLDALLKLLDGADAAVAAKAVGPHWWHHGRAKARAAIAKATGAAA